MGKKVICPECGNHFYIEGWEEYAECYRCESVFEAQDRIVFGS
jgi:uncharacterized CHY-type Zn-finger protein